VQAAVSCGRLPRSRRFSFRDRSGVTSPYRKLPGRVYRFGRNLRYCLWLLKNSFGVFVLKTRRARMPYKRFSPPRDTFLVTRFRQFQHL
jgi:hypothetical protein